MDIYQAALRDISSAFLAHKPDGMEGVIATFDRVAQALEKHIATVALLPKVVEQGATDCSAAEREGK